MSFLRTCVRTGFDKPYFSAGNQTLVPQYEPMILSFGTFMAGLLCIVWMLIKVVSIEQRGLTCIINDHCRELQHDTSIVEMLDHGNL